MSEEKICLRSRASWKCNLAYLRAPEKEKQLHLLPSKLRRCPYCARFGSNAHISRCGQQLVNCAFCRCELELARLAAHEEYDCEERRKRVFCPACEKIVPIQGDVFTDVCQCVDNEPWIVPTPPGQKAKGNKQKKGGAPKRGKKKNGVVESKAAPPTKRDAKGQAGPEPATQPARRGSTKPPVPGVRRPAEVKSKKC
ncbi:unnamed protein product [Trypanosoma congolense IL3000]|uniref:WGS project CAEQ00000000 data, annotated contig 1114 n=1 Tax=Trypanosoma congolense (strain IL3000) TaxID=1068625 RepID=F9W3V1_TRYCI|nr:unnamed protein product [Trypanosoma congolense IL3000]